MSDYTLETLKQGFRWQAEWRRERAKEYPLEAALQLQAAAYLDRLADTAKDVNPAVFEAYKELQEGCEDIEAESDLLKQIGFSWFPKSASEFVREFISNRTGG